MVDIHNRNQRALTIQSEKQQVREDREKLTDLFRETFHDGAPIWRESEAYQREVLEEFEEADLDYLALLDSLEVERLLVLTDDPGFVVEAFGLAGQSNPGDPTHIEGYEWVNPQIEEGPVGGGVGTDSVRLGSPSRDAVNSRAAVDAPTTPPHGGGLTEIKAILAENQTVPEERKLAVVSRFAWISAGLNLAPEDGACAHAIMRRAVEGKGDADLKVSPKLKDALHSLVKLWQAQPDDAYWTNVAHMIDLGLVVNSEASPFTIADQIFFMNFAVEMSPLKELWSWKTLDDVWDVANAIRSSYDKSHLVSDMYRHCPAVTYQGRVMPRGVTAKMLQLALGLLARDLREKKV